LSNTVSSEKAGPNLFGLCIALSSNSQYVHRSTA